METINARAALRLPFSEILKLDRKAIKLEFDDEVIETTTPRLIFSHLLWDMHRLYPKMPLLREHFVADGAASSRSAIDPLGKALWTCHETYPALNWQEIEHLWVLISNMTNNAYNFVVEHCGEYIHSKSILDIIHVLRDEEVTKLREGLPEMYEQHVNDPIGTLNKSIEKIVMEQPRFDRNQYVRTIRSYSVKTGQSMQICGAIGNKTDHDNLIFDFPVAGNFGLGMRNLTELGMESCSAKVALLSSKKGLPDTEYANRRMQLACSIVSTVHKGDCGSTEYLDWKVTKENFKFLIGKYYFDEGRTDTLRPIRKHTSKDLIGTWIKMRTVLGCQHTDKHGVCSKCLGDVALSIPFGTNLGHVAATQLGEQVSQAVLSIKHMESSANALAIVLGDIERTVFKADRRAPKIKLADKVNPAHIRLTFDLNEVSNISDVRQVKNVRELPIARVSQISRVEVKTTKPDGTETLELMNVSASGRLASMSHDLLEHIRDNWFVSQSTTAVTVDMTGWDPKKTMFELPMKHLSMIDYMACVIAMISSSESKDGRNNFAGKNIKRLTEFNCPKEALAEFFDLISAKLSVNLAYLEVIIHSLRAADPANNDYDLPNRGELGSIARYNEVLANRDIAGMMAYEGHQKTLVSPSSYTITKRPPHLLGPVFMPR